MLSQLLSVGSVLCIGMIEYNSHNTQSLSMLCQLGLLIHTQKGDFKKLFHSYILDPCNDNINHRKFLSVHDITCSFSSHSLSFPSTFFLCLFTKTFPFFSFAFFFSLSLLSFLLEEDFEGRMTINYTKWQHSRERSNHLKNNITDIKVPLQL